MVVREGKHRFTYCAILVVEDAPLLVRKLRLGYGELVQGTQLGFAHK